MCLVALLSANLAVASPSANYDYSYRVARFKDPKCAEHHPAQVRVAIISKNCLWSEFSDRNRTITQSESFEPHGDDKYTVKTFRSHDCTGDALGNESFEASKLWLGGGMDPLRPAVDPCSCIPAALEKELFFSVNVWTPFGDLWWLRNGSSLWTDKLRASITKCPWQPSCEDAGPWCSDAVLDIKRDGAPRCSLSARCCASCKVFFGVSTADSATCDDDPFGTSCAAESEDGDEISPIVQKDSGEDTLEEKNGTSELKETLVADEECALVNESREVQNTVSEQDTVKEKLGADRNITEKLGADRNIMECEKLLSRFGDNCGFGPLPRLVPDGTKQKYVFDLPQEHCHASICKRYDILRAAAVCRPLVCERRPGRIAFLHNDTFAAVLIRPMCEFNSAALGKKVRGTFCDNEIPDASCIAEGSIMPLFEEKCSKWALPAFTETGFDETKLRHPPSHDCTDALCTMLLSVAQCVGCHDLPIPMKRCPLLNKACGPEAAIESREYWAFVVILAHVLPRHIGQPLAVVCSVPPVELWPFAFLNMAGGGLPPTLVAAAILLRKQGSAIVGMDLERTLCVGVLMVICWLVIRVDDRVRNKWTEVAQASFFVLLCWNDCEEEQRWILLLASISIVIMFRLTLRKVSDSDISIADWSPSSSPTFEMASPLFSDMTSPLLSEGSPTLTTPRSASDRRWAGRDTWQGEIRPFPRDTRRSKSQ